LIFDIKLVVRKLRCEGSLGGEFWGMIATRIKKGDVKVIDDSLTLITKERSPKPNRISYRTTR
jgi:hypothetical protein